MIAPHPEPSPSGGKGDRACAVDEGQTTAVLKQTSQAWITSRTPRT